MFFHDTTPFLKKETNNVSRSDSIDANPSFGSIQVSSRTVQHRYRLSRSTLYLEYITNYSIYKFFKVFLNRKYFSFRYSFTIKLKVIPKQFIVYLLSFFQFHPPQGAFL